MPRLLLTVPEAAEALAISRSKFYELLASATLPLSASTDHAASRSPPWRSTSPGCSPKGPPRNDRCQATPPTRGDQEGRS